MPETTATGVKTWMDGDFNFDGVADVSDLSLLATSYRLTNPYFPGGGSPVPEPMTLTLLGLAGLGLVCRRRRR